MAAGTSARAGRPTALACVAALTLLAGCGGSTASTAPTPGPAGAASTAAPSAPVASTTAVPTATAAPTASPAACVAPPAGIVAWWPAEDDAKDVIGGHDGTLEGNAGFTAGMVGRAFAFDGATQFVSVSPSTALQLKTGITIEGWVRAAGALTGNAGIAGTWNDNAGAFRTYLFWVLGGQTQELVVSSDHASYLRAADPEPFPSDTWVHVAATFDGATIRVYRDGVEGGSAAMAGQIATNELPFLIGRTEGGSQGPNFWKGSIDELAVYDRALTATELAAIHAAGSAGKCQP